MEYRLQNDPSSNQMIRIDSYDGLWKFEILAQKYLWM